MKTKLIALLALCLFAARTWGSTPEQEKAFTDKYKAAYEAKDMATLYSFLYTENANPMALGFYKMMMGGSAGHKIATIELVDLSPEDAEEAAAVQDGPGGTKTRLPLKPTKKLRIKVEIKEGDNSSSTTNEAFVAEKDGKLLIPVPVDVK